MAHIIHVSKSTLDHVLKESRVSEKNRQIAHAFFVERKQQNEIVALLGASRANVSRVIRAVREKLSTQLTESDWVVKELELPKSTMDKLSLLVGELKRLQKPKVAANAMDLIDRAIDKALITAIGKSK